MRVTFTVDIPIQSVVAESLVEDVLMRMVEHDIEFEFDIDTSTNGHGGHDVVWNPHVNGGEFQIFEVDSDHTGYQSAKDLAEVIQIIR